MENDEKNKIDLEKNKLNTENGEKNKGSNKFNDYYNGNNNNNSNGNGNNNPNNQQKNAKPSRNYFNVIIAIIMILIFGQLIFSYISNRSSYNISYTAFLTLVESDFVESVTLNGNYLTIRVKEDADMEEVKDITKITEAENALAENPVMSEIDIPKTTLDFKKVRFVTGYIDDPNFVKLLVDKNISLTRTSETSSPLLGILATWILPFCFLYFVYIFLSSRAMQSGGMMNVGKSKAKEYNVEDGLKIRFTDVAGQDEAKESLIEMVDYLNNPEKYAEIGAKQPRGALLVGPPGTGKTLLAKAVAGEAHVPFYSLSGSEFVEMFVGVGASRVRDLFSEAKKNSPCIIFIDEIDAIGKSRDAKFGSHSEQEQTLNQLLAEMDGFDNSSSVIVLAATNRPETLDKALLRPGRFDRRIIVERPDLVGREAILQVHGKNVKLHETADLHKIALATSGASGADLANMINEGALNAVRDGRNKVEQKDLMEAVEVVIAGKEKKDRILSQKEKEIVSYHEVGHALVSALQTNSKPVQKITIVPRTMGALGYTMNVPEEEKYLMTKDEILSEIRTLLGGRAAEIVKFNEISTGASNDIDRATALARSMVAQYGMSDYFGSVSFDTVENQYLDGKKAFNGSEKSSELIDKEVIDIIKKCQNESLELLKNNLPSLEKISQFLLEKENIDGDEFMELFGTV